MCVCVCVYLNVKYIYITYYYVVWGIWLSGTTKSYSFYYSKPEVPNMTPGSSCFSLVFIENLIND